MVAVDDKVSLSQSVPREEVRADPPLPREGLEVVQVVGATGEDNFATALVKLKNKTCLSCG